jgi:hypothetical protein
MSLGLSAGCNYVCTFLKISVSSVDGVEVKLYVFSGNFVLTCSKDFLLEFELTHCGWKM